MIIVGAAIFLEHSLWQLDIICVNPIWQTPGFIQGGGLGTSNGQFYKNFPFGDGPIYQGTVGGAYDFFLGMNIAMFIAGIVGTFILMLGVTAHYRTQTMTLKRNLREQTDRMGNLGQ